MCIMIKINIFDISFWSEERKKIFLFSVCPWKMTKFVGYVKHANYVWKVNTSKLPRCLFLSENNKIMY